MRRIAQLVSLALLASLSAFAAGECKFVKTAEWTVNAGGDIPVVEGAINGSKVGVALDTGTTVSRIAGSAADRLGLVRREAAGLYAVSTGDFAVDATSIREFRVGGITVTNWGKLIIQATEARDYAVVLGYDFFRQFDVEFDLAHNAVRLFRPQDCSKTVLAYWGPQDARQIPLDRDNWRPAMLVPVKLNGKSATALLSSGTAHSVVSTALATRPLESFAIGDELIRNPAVRVGDLGGRDMLLGLDFLRAHRVLVSNSQGLVYFTYIGGRVFETAR